MLAGLSRLGTLNEQPCWLANCLQAASRRAIGGGTPRSQRGAGGRPSKARDESVSRGNRELDYGACPGRHLGMALRILARSVFSERSFAAAPAPILRQSVLHHRTQRRFLSNSEPGC